MVIPCTSYLVLGGVKLFLSVSQDQSAVTVGGDGHSGSIGEPDVLRPVARDLLDRPVRERDLHHPAGITNLLLAAARD